jgi:hypothetical protein
VRPVADSLLGSPVLDDLLPHVTPRGSYKPLAGQRTNSGKDLYRYVVWLEIDPRFVDQITSVRYRFNHPTFGINGYVASQAPQFSTTYDGWGCVDSVTATINTRSGPPQNLEFNQCAAIESTR